MVTLRFNRVVFGVSASPFLLNATINHHMDTYRELDPVFADKFQSSIYVDDLVSGSHDVESTYEFYAKSKLRLAVAGFNTKRNIVSVTAKFFDPLGVVSPVTILFKMFCQQLCEAKVGWDELLAGRHLEWHRLRLMLRGAKTISIPRNLYRAVARPAQSVKLVGFCDASTKAYAAVVYMRLESEACVDVQFLAAKTQVAPVGGTTVPRLELLSALLLSKLITSIGSVLEHELPLGDPVCFTDSKAALYSIRGVSHEWKQFVENRVNTIRSLIQPQHWRHCPLKEYPADIPSRGMNA